MGSQRLGLNGRAAAALADSGARLFAGHHGTHVGADGTLVIYSGAVPADNVERRVAARRGLVRRSYAQALAALMAESRGLAVAGTHGKSTTSAMITQILTCAGLDPTVICGAAGLDGGCGGRAGQGDWFVAEACEYQGNFLGLRPEISVVLNIEPDHFDCFHTPAQLTGVFEQFLYRTTDLIVANHDCPTVRRIIPAAGTRVTTFGEGADADWRAVSIEQTAGRHRFDICCRGRFVCRVSLRVPGRHQVANALAAAAASHAAGAGGTDIARGLENFRGLRRRMEHVATVGGVDFLDDYAHHPTEVRAALAAVRLAYPGRRICCVFQPHQISRTLALLDGFAASLQNADAVAVAQVFVAREHPTADPLALAEQLRLRVRDFGAEVLPDCRAETILNRIVSALQSGDVVITLGAGDIRKQLYELVDRFRAYRPTG